MMLIDILGKKEGKSESKIDQLETNSKNMNIVDLYNGINEFNKGCEPKNNLVKDFVWMEESFFSVIECTWV
jgi:hypothetical protein